MGFNHNCIMWYAGPRPSVKWLRCQYAFLIFLFLLLFHLETPGEQIVRKLTFERIEELKKSIRNDQLTYK